MSVELFGQCPHCWSKISILADEGGGELQEYVEDCEVCCRPLQVIVHLGDEPSLELRPLDEA